MTPKKKSARKAKRKVAPKSRKKVAPKGPALELVRYKKEWPALKSETRHTASLSPYARNARTHSKAQVAQIADSIKEWGWTNPILIDEDDTIIAGHGRVLAAELIEIEVVPVVVADSWTTEQKRAYVLADNRLALSAGWDNDLLSLELTELSGLDFDINLIGFEPLELKTLMRDGKLDDDDAAAPPLPEAPTSAAGDIWLLGPHRLICGDATDAKVVDAVLDGVVPRLMVTDPPYGVEYNPKWRHDAGVNNSKRIGKVENDERIDWTAAWRLFPGDVAYVWHAGLHAGEVALNLQEAGLVIRSQIIWSKDRFAISRGNYHWHHEPCWYAVREKKKAHWIGGRKESTLWEIAGSNSSGEEKTIHGTQKPLECMGRPMRNHDAEAVYDPFLGSGSTLIAAQKQDRRCFAIDIDPRYVDVAVIRWQNLTGKDAVLHGKGGKRSKARTFNAISETRRGAK